MEFVQQHPPHGAGALTCIRASASTAESGHEPVEVSATAAAGEIPTIERIDVVSQSICQQNGFAHDQRITVSATDFAGASVVHFELSITKGVFDLGNAIADAAGTVWAQLSLCRRPRGLPAGHRRGLDIPDRRLSEPGPRRQRPAHRQCPQSGRVSVRARDRPDLSRRLLGFAVLLLHGSAGPYPVHRPLAGAHGRPCDHDPPCLVPAATSRLTRAAPELANRRGRVRHSLA